jgi:hypothetical protein
LVWFENHYSRNVCTTDTRRKGLFRDSSLHTHPSPHRIFTTHNTQLTYWFLMREENRTEYSIGEKPLNGV